MHRLAAGPVEACEPHVSVEHRLGLTRAVGRNAVRDVVARVLEHEQEGPAGPDRLANRWVGRAVQVERGRQQAVLAGRSVDYGDLAVAREVEPAGAEPAGDLRAVRRPGRRLEPRLALRQLLGLAALRVEQVHVMDALDVPVLVAGGGAGRSLSAPCPTSAV